MLKRIPIRLKLILLAGVPVIGALILATIIARDARRQAESVAALGSIEDLAHLSAKMSSLVHALQLERNELSLRSGQKALASPSLQQCFQVTDAARTQLREFLAAREVSSLPPRLARDLKTAEQRLNGLQAEREAALAGQQRIDLLFNYYKHTDLALISATAALSQLADDGELLRAISALVIVMQIKERASQEHALLSHVFAINEFPAGTYKELVTLTTEEADYVGMLNVQATDRVSRQFAAISQGPEFARAAELRTVALETEGDDFKAAPEEWSRVQGTKLERWRGLVVALNEAVKVAAVAKVGAAARAVRLSYGLGAGVIALSALLAGLIARGISRSVGSLAEAAEQVSQQKNFRIRAQKTSEDELGSLADTFNEMLSGIEARDAELRHRGENLERLVEQRTSALQIRNEAMRLVLDNVEQGLATIERDGTLSLERSRAFDNWFGGGAPDASFAEQLARGNLLVCETLKIGWEQVTDGFLPLEAAIDQLPRHIEVEQRRFALSYKPIVEQGLLSVEAAKPELLMRALHTLKGSCSISGVDSVADVAHRLETWLSEARGSPTTEQYAELTNAWQAFAARVRRLSATQAESALEISSEELQELETATRGRAPHAELAVLLTRLNYERGIVRLRRVAEQAKSLAQRLGKGELDVQVEASPDVRFQAERWAPFWAAFVHVLRNALDHGVESGTARLAAGKPERAKLKLVAASDAGFLSIEISDDGRGIDWARVADIAAARGLPSASQKDLVDALFCDGLSTAQSVTDVSGRGVGMSAVRDAALSLGGVVTLASTPGVGTTVRFRFPLAQATNARDASAPPRLVVGPAPGGAWAHPHGRFLL